MPGSLALSCIDHTPTVPADLLSPQVNLRELRRAVERHNDGSAASRTESNCTNGGDMIDGEYTGAGDMEHCSDMAFVVCAPFVFSHFRSYPHLLDT